MKSRFIVLTSLVGALFLASSAGASVIAGWDFSQFKFAGSLAGGSAALEANYSVFDPNGAGSESAAFGTATFNGAVLLPTSGGGMNCERLPDGFLAGCATPNVDGPIRSNTHQDFDFGKPSFNSFGILRDEGQTYANRMAMQANGATDVTLEVDTAAGFGGVGWAVSFGGKLATGNGPNGGQTDCDPSPGCSSTVTVEYSKDGIGYSSLPSQVLSLDDERFVVPVPAGYTDKLFVRLGLNASAGRPVIDNVAVSATPVPEPGLMVQLGAGTLGLGLLARRRTQAAV